MKVKILVIALFLVSISSFSQELIYKPSGRVFDSNNQKLSPSEVRVLLKGKPGMLNFYNAGRAKKTFGNILFTAGLGLLATDVMLGLNRKIDDTKKYPTALTYAGVASLIISIPIKIGNGKKVKAMVEEYNKQLKPETAFNIEKVNIITNQNGIGMRASF